MNSIIAVPVDISKVKKVYSGKSHTCYCGCAGKYYYPNHDLEAAGKARGYEIRPEEISDTQVKRIVNKINKNLDQCTNYDDHLVVVQIGNHDYTAYFV